MSRCAFGRSTKIGQKSCFKLAELECMVQAWNALEPKSKIELDMREQDADALWDELYDKLKNRDERRWLENTAFMDQVEATCPQLANTIKYLALRPFFFGSMDDLWLAQKDINHCLVQLLYCFRKCVSPTLQYLGAQPVDYFIRHPEHVKIPFDEDWGIVLNTATQQEGGEHWVALFHARDTFTLEYFDSNGELPSPRVHKILTTLKSKNKYLKTVRLSEKEHQEDEYNCGVYTILFLFLRYIQVPFEKIEAEKMGFSHITQFRDLLFDKCMKT